MNKIKSIKEEIIDKVTILDNQLKRLKWYLNEIRDEELRSLDIDLDEYETGRYDTDYSNIINLVEEALCADINYHWQDLAPEEKVQIKEILE